MAGTEAAPAAGPTAGTPGVEKVVKVAIEGRGWDVLKLMGFEIEVYSESKVAKGRFVVNEYSCQPFGVLHGGTTAYVAESVASLLTAYVTNFQRVAGVELNVNHLRPAALGSEVLLTATPYMLGKRLQVWEVKFETEKPKPAGSDSETPELILIAVSRVSIMVFPPEDGDVKVRTPQSSFVGMTFTEAETVKPT